MADHISPQRQSGDRLMRPAEASAVFGMTPGGLRSVRRLTVQRTPGGHRRYLPDEVYALAAALKVEAVSA